jgi:periplasmic divalent cation tolerance protein
MEAATTYVTVQVSTETDEQARTIADAVVAQSLAACVHIVPIQSVYRWEGAIHHDAEHLLLIKTRLDAYPHLETLIKQQHPYDVPEIIVSPIITGAHDYLAWMDETIQIP